MSDDNSPITANISRSDIGLNILEFAVPFAVASYVAYRFLSSVQFDLKLLGLSVLRDRHRTSRLFKPLLFERIAAWIFVIFALILIAPPALLIAWGFYSYYSLSQLYGLTVALIGLSLYFLFLGIWRWQFNEWRLVRSVRILFFLSIALLFIFELWMVFLSKPYTFIGLSAVLLSFNMVPISQLAFLVSTSGGHAKAFQEYPQVRRQMKKAAAAVGVKLIKMQEEQDEERAQRRALRARNGDRQHSISISSMDSSVQMTPVRPAHRRAVSSAAFTLAQANAVMAAGKSQMTPITEDSEQIADSPPNDAVAVTITDNPASPSDVSRTGGASSPAQAGAVPTRTSTPPPPSHPSFSSLISMSILSLVSLFGYAVIAHFAVDSDPYIGFITASAIATVDVSLFLCVLHGEIRDGTNVLWLAICSRFLLVFFGSDLYFMGHCIMYLLMSFFFGTHILDTLLPYSNEHAIRERLITVLQRGEFFSLDADGNIAEKDDTLDPVAAGATPATPAATSSSSSDSSFEQEQQQRRRKRQLRQHVVLSHWIVRALLDRYENRCCSCLSHERLIWILNLLPVWTMMFLTGSFVIDLIVNSRVAQLEIVLQESHPQYIVGIITLLLVLFLFLCRILIRFYINYEYQLSKPLLRWAAFTYTLILSVGLCFHYLSLFNSFLSALICVFFPPIFSLTIQAFFQWKKQDFSWILPRSHRNPPMHKSFLQCFFKGGLPIQDYYMIATLSAVVGLLLLFGHIVSYFYNPWWIGFTGAGGYFVLFTTILPIVQWFGTLEWSSSIISLGMFSGGSFFGCIVLYWIFVLDYSTELTVGMEIIMLIILYPSLVVLVVGIYKWYDDNWKVTGIVKLSIGFGIFIIMAFFLAIAIVFPPWQVGATGLMLFLIGMFFQTYLPYVTRWSPRVSKALVVAAFLIIFIFAFSVGFKEGTGFIGFSIGWAGCEMVLILMSYNIYYPIDTTHDQPIYLYVYSSSILPVYRYGATAGASSGTNPLTVYNRRVGCIYSVIFGFYLWAVLCVYFITPPVVGLGLSSLAIVACIVYSVQVSRYSNEQLERQMHFLGAEEEHETALGQTQEATQQQQKKQNQHGMEESHLLYSAMLKRACEISATSQLTRNSQSARLGRSNLGGGVIRPRLSPEAAAVLKGSTYEAELEVKDGGNSDLSSVTGGRAATGRRGYSLTMPTAILPTAQSFYPLMHSIMSEVEAEEFLEKIESDATVSTGIYNWRSAFDDFTDLAASIPWPSFLCSSSVHSDKNVAFTRDRHLDDQRGDLSEEARAFLNQTQMEFKGRRINRVGAYFVLGVLRSLYRLLYSAESRFEIQAQVELTLQIEARHLERNRMMERAVALLRIRAGEARMNAMKEAAALSNTPKVRTATIAAAAAAAAVANSNNNNNATAPTGSEVAIQQLAPSAALSATPIAASFDLSRNTLLRLLRDPARRRELAQAMRDLEMEVHRMRQVKRAKRLAELKAASRRTLLAAGRKEEAIRAFRKDNELAAAFALAATTALSEEKPKLTLGSTPTVAETGGRPSMFKKPAFLRKGSILPQREHEIEDENLANVFNDKRDQMQSLEEKESGEEDTRKQAEWLLSTRLKALENEMKNNRTEQARLKEEISHRAVAFQTALNKSEATHLVSHARSKEMATTLKSRREKANADVEAEKAALAARNQSAPSDRLRSLEAVFATAAQSELDHASYNAKLETANTERQAEMRTLDSQRLESDARARSRIETLQVEAEGHAERQRLLEEEKMHWWNQRQTLRKTMENDLLSIDKPLQQGVCSFSATGTKLTFQRWYTCFECGLEGARGFCEACRRRCHPSHHFIRSHLSPFYCHCGWSASVHLNPTTLKPGSPGTMAKECVASKGPLVKSGSQTHLHPPTASLSGGSSTTTTHPTSSVTGTTVNVDDHSPLSSRRDQFTIHDNLLSSHGGPQATTGNLSDEAAFQKLPPLEQVKVLSRACADRGTKWTDNTFPPGALALYIDPEKVGGAKLGWDKLVWRRASEHVKNPALFVPPFQPDTIKQGLLGDCYLMSALAVLTLRPELLQNIFVTNSYSEHGIYAVKFYKNGVIKTVLVDDWFPCLPPSSGENDEEEFVSAFGKSLTSNELFVMVLEKAYAKLHYSYESIESGCVDSGLVDLTGGIGDRVDLTSPATQQAIRNGSLWNDLRGWFESGYLLGAGSPAGDDSEDSASKFGIVQGHAYAILNARKVDDFCLLRLRNPWGRFEWTGKFSDTDTVNWTKRLKKKVGFVQKDDGSFWMEFNDFIQHFEDIYICRFFDRKQWVYYREIKGQWKGLNAGGCTNHYSVVHSPQFALVLHVPCDVVLTLAQYDSRGQDRKKQQKVESSMPSASSTTVVQVAEKGEGAAAAEAAEASLSQVAIGIEVYDNNGQRVSRRRRGKLVASNPSSFTFRREVTAQFNLPLLSGDRPYTVLIATHQPFQEKQYILQVYATKPIEFDAMPAI